MYTTPDFLQPPDPEKDRIWAQAIQSILRGNVCMDINHVMATKNEPPKTKHPLEYVPTLEINPSYVVD